MPSGGKRIGAGRPTKTQALLKEAKSTIKELHELTRGGLYTAAEAFGELIDAEVDTALHDEDPKVRVQARHYLIDLVAKTIRVRDEEAPLLIKVFQRWSNDDVARESPRPAINSTYTVVE